MKNPLFSSVYCHLPFCEVICHYCDFYTDRSSKADHERLAAAMAQHLSLSTHSLSPNIDTLYLGGGTPSKTPPASLAKILRSLEPRLREHTEITLECNPSDCTHENIQAWRSLGFNRASLGIQSLNDGTLRRIGRNHNGSEALTALDRLLCSFPSVSVDLMYGIPGQSEDDPANDARQLIEKGAHHLSAYHLTLQEKHFLFKRLPDQSLARSQLERIRDYALELGLSHYEVSNFCRPGHGSRHNQIYWTGLPYLAIGPSAHGFDGKSKRWQLIAHWKHYCERVESGEPLTAMEENLSVAQRQMETLFTALRTERGLDRARWEKEFAWDPLEKSTHVWSQWEEKGWALAPTDQMRLTFAGQMLTDSLVLTLIKHWETLDS